MYGMTHFFNGGFLMMGFTTRFIIALVILSYLYSKNKSDKNLKRGMTILVVFGVVVFALILLVVLMFFSIGGIGALFGGLFSAFNNFGGYLHH
ncbi:MAG: hypothetical protein RR011_00765 [Oscillospiraceae bacterium]